MPFTILSSRFQVDTNRFSIPSPLLERILALPFKARCSAGVNTDCPSVSIRPYNQFLEPSVGKSIAPVLIVGNSRVTSANTRLIRKLPREIRLNLGLALNMKSKYRPIRRFCRFPSFAQVRKFLNIVGQTLKQRYFQKYEWLSRQALQIFVRSGLPAHRKHSAHLLPAPLRRHPFESGKLGRQLFTQVFSD